MLAKCERIKDNKKLFFKDNHYTYLLYFEFFDEEEHKIFKYFRIFYVANNYASYDPKSIFSLN